MGQEERGEKIQGGKEGNDERGHLARLLCRMYKEDYLSTLNIYRHIYICNCMNLH